MLCARVRREVLQRAHQSASLLRAGLYWETFALEPPPAMAALAQGALPGPTASAGPRATENKGACAWIPCHQTSRTPLPRAQPSLSIISPWNQQARVESQAHGQEHSALGWSQPNGRGRARARALAEEPACPLHAQSVQQNRQGRSSLHGASSCAPQCSLLNRSQPVRSHHARGASLACSAVAHQDVGSSPGADAERTEGEADVAFPREVLSCCEAEKAPLRVAVLLSGGVDSSVALRLLHAAGHRCTAFYLKIWFQEDFRNSWEQCPWEEDLGYAQAVCDQIGVELWVVHLTEEYWSLVVSHCMDEIQSGRTPNPDMLCNSRVKFGAFFSHLDFEHFDRVASGHYARIVELEGPNGTPASANVGQHSSTQRTVALTLTKDPVKDQTYFLSHLSQQQLARAMFPLGALTKAEVREWATRLALPNCSRRDSQGICFLGKVKFGEFLAERIGEREGRILEAETGEELGRHRGFWFYTIGQRQGIRLSGGPWYVVAKDTERNVVFVSKTYYSSDKSRRSFWVGTFSWLTPGANWTNHVATLANVGLQAQGDPGGAELGLQGQGSIRPIGAERGYENPREVERGEEEVQSAAADSSYEGGEGGLGAGLVDVQPLALGEGPLVEEAVSGAPAASVHGVPHVDWSNVLVKVRHGPKLYRCAVEFLSHDNNPHSGDRQNRGGVQEDESWRERDAVERVALAQGVTTNGAASRQALHSTVPQDSSPGREDSGSAPSVQATLRAEGPGQVVDAEFVEELDARPGEPWDATGALDHSGAARNALSQTDNLSGGAPGDALGGTPDVPSGGPRGDSVGSRGGVSAPRKEALVRIEEDDQGLAAGQYAVFYAGDVCLGGAMILGMPEDGVRSAVSPEAMLAAQRSELDWEAVYDSKKSKKKAKKTASAMKAVAIDAAQTAAV